MRESKYIHMSEMRDRSIDIGIGDHMLLILIESRIENGWKSRRSDLWMEGWRIIKYHIEGCQSVL